MRRFKMYVASRLKGFVDYWNMEAENQRLNSTVKVLRGTVVNSDVVVGQYTYVGSNSTIASGSIGAFCSIANNVVIGVDDHSLSSVSTHPFWSSPQGWTFETSDSTERWVQQKSAPIIGHDVWIGANVVVVRGAIIEDGAVIGAGAVVTSRIPAYAIAVGVPARVIRYRFNSETCERLRNIKWWDWEYKRIDRHRAEFADVMSFIDNHG